MRAKPRVIQFLNSVLHIFVSEEFDNPGSIFVDVCEADIPSFAHMVLQVLPTATRRESYIYLLAPQSKHDSIYKYCCNLYIS